MLRLTEQQARYYANEAYIAAFNARSAAEIELDLIERKDRLSDADKARMADLRHVIAARG